MTWYKRSGKSWADCQGALENPLAKTLNPGKITLESRPELPSPSLTSDPRSPSWCRKGSAVAAAARAVCCFWEVDSGFQGVFEGEVDLGI